MLVHRIVGIPYARTIAPLEIVGSFFVESIGSGRRGSNHLAVHLEPQERRRRRAPKPEERILLVTGDRVAEAAAALNLALGRLANRAR